VVHFPNALINTLAPKIFFHPKVRMALIIASALTCHLLKLEFQNRLQLVLEIQDLHQILLVVIRRLMVHPVLPHPHLLINVSVNGLKLKSPAG
jgi:hypothetical protein